MARKAKKESAVEEVLELATVQKEEHPYQIPENWCWTRLSSVVTTSKVTTDDFSDASVMYLGLENIEKDKGITSYSSSNGIKSLKNVFTKGQLLYGKLRPYLNKHDIAPFDGICSTDILVFDVKQTTLNQYVDYFFSTELFIDYAVSNSKGINLPRVSEKIVLKALCPLPPLPEQQRIVDRIESLFAKLDEAKEKAQAVVDGFEDRKAAILHKAFTGELTEQWRKKNGIPRDSWYKSILNSLCLKITDGTHHSPPNESSGDYMYVTAKNIKEMYIDLSNITYVTKDIHDEIFTRCDVRKGDVLYIKDGATTGISTVNYIEEPFSLLSSVAVLRPNLAMIIPEYLAYMLNSSEVKAMMINNMSGNAITRLTLTKIKSSEITVCSVKEQLHIVELLKSLIEKEQKAKEAAELVIAQIDTMKKSILARAFRGELGTNDPNDESAVELLKSTVLM